MREEEVGGGRSDGCGGMWRGVGEEGRLRGVGVEGSRREVCWDVVGLLPCHTRTATPAPSSAAIWPALTEAVASKS